MPSSSKNDDELAKPATTRGTSKADEQWRMDNLGDTKVARPSQGFIKGLPKGVEPSFLPTKRTEEGFDPNACKLMSKAGYNFTSSANLGKNDLNTVKDNKRDFTKTQKKLEEHGYGVNNNKAGLGFTPNAPMKISSKAKNASAQHISFRHLNSLAVKTELPSSKGLTRQHLEALFSKDEIEKYYQLLLKYKDVFAWTYKEMPGLDPIIAVHHLAVEIDKLIEAGFIREDDFPLPIIEIMVDATTGHEALLFMDGYSGYNQIRMALEDEELTAFRTPKGIYCYKVMPFGLKNAGATYQRAMQKIFNDMLHKNVECYVDDVVVKTKKRSDHLKDL
ncbi:hypothetical protein ACFX19_038807 [Malus domestica]